MNISIGDADKKAPESFDATAALNNLGWIAETELDAALSQLAALREELGQCKGEYDRSANRVSALQDELAELEEEFDTLEHTNITLKQRLADAERRNAELEGLLRDTKTVLSNELSYALFHKLHNHFKRIDAALLAAPEAPRQEPVPKSEWDTAANPVLGYADSYRDMARQGVKTVDVWSVITDLERNIAPLYAAPLSPDHSGGAGGKVVLPEGWKAVPIDPTDEMIVAFAQAWYSKRQVIDDPDMLDAYRDMLAVSPELNQ